MSTVIEILKLARALTELGEKVVEAAMSENPKRVEEIFPATLETSIAKLRAEIEAVQKFGLRP